MNIPVITLSNGSPPNNDYDQVEAIISSAIFALIVIPTNCILIGALCRQEIRTWPLSALFINVAIFDILYLLARTSWFYASWISPSQSQCSGSGLLLRIFEKSTEVTSSFCTAAIAMIRAFAVWKSTKKQELHLTKRTMCFILLTIWALGIAGPTLLIVVISCERITQCPGSLTPLYGLSEVFHAFAQLLLVNTAVIVCYSYICITLSRHGKSMRALGLSDIEQSHKRAIKLLIAYILIYTVSTTPVHIWLIFYHSCTNVTSDAGQTVFTVAATLFPIGACGCNPVFLYVLSGVIKKSVSVIISPLRSCSGA